LIAISDDDCLERDMTFNFKPNNICVQTLSS
jgi:hypothetical protein